MIRRLLVVTAALAGAGALVAPGARAAESTTSVETPTLGCVWVGNTGVCVDNPIRKLP